MIDFVKGAIIIKNPAFVVLETTGGVGYRINISLNTYAKIESMEHTKLLTYLQVREDAHVLFGFAEESERSLFQMLISVSGVGPSTAQVLLSGMSADEARAAILSENEAAFSKVKGIGPKTAKRIILDLKDKVKKDGGEVTLNLATTGNSTIRDEAISALLALGFQRIPIQKVLNKILQEQKIANVEDLIKIALKQLM
ncbi:MAG: Holliday junction branch migration protein RuvA [Saprospiraceae bacterium]|nr:Holliday junction branch migration protein RuvA [Saprospiraceae bacterium]